MCFSEHTTYDPSYGEYVPTPADTVEARCWHKTVVWTERNCHFSADLTLKKDGKEVWTASRGMRTDPDHTGRTKVTGFWKCQGHGTYSLTLHNITMYSEGHRHVGEWVQVYPEPVTVTASGC